MHKVEPDIHVIAVTEIQTEALEGYLESIGAVGWETDAETGVEELIEVMGRGCYKSFGTELNSNITKVRDSNREYLANIIKQKHGAVLEHSWISFMITDLSRIGTHELVRHKVGVAISQESLRYVRLEDLGLWIPSCFRNNPKAVEIFERGWRQAEDNYSELLSEDVLGFDMDAEGFSNKKIFTSGARRLIPMGMATNIGWSCNIRALRHVIEQRTSRHAEEEIRLVFGKVADIVFGMYPNLFSDFKSTRIRDLLEWTPLYSKV